MPRPAFTLCNRRLAQPMLAGLFQFCYGSLLPVHLLDMHDGVVNFIAMMASSQLGVTSPAPLHQGGIGQMALGICVTDWIHSCLTNLHQIWTGSSALGHLVGSFANQRCCTRQDGRSFISTLPIPETWSCWTSDQHRPSWSHVP